MRALIIIIGLLLAAPAWGASYNVILQYEPDASWQTDGDSSWLNLDIGGIVAPRRIAVAFEAGGVEIARLWDDPDNRTLPFAVSFDMPGPRAKITGHTYAYEGGPWRATTAYAVGDLLAAGPLDATTGLETTPSSWVWWQCNRAGTSGSARPGFGAGKTFRSDFVPLADSGRLGLTGAAVDLGGGLVSLPVGSAFFASHDFVAGDEVRILGTTNYNGVHTLPDQSLGDNSHVVISATYVAETFDLTQTIWRTEAEAVDLGGGLVSIPASAHGLAAGEKVALWGTANYTFPGSCITGSAIDLGSGRVAISTTAAHGFVAGDAVRITGTTNYDGIHVLPAQTGGDADTFVINATYTAETFVDCVGYATELYTLPDQTLGDADHVVITAPFVSEGFLGTYNFVVYSGRTVDNGDGTVTISVPSHGFIQGDVVSINGTDNFDGVHILPAQTLGDADHLVVTASWADEQMTGTEIVARAVDDPDGSGAQWVLMRGDVIGDQQTVLSAEPTGRIIVRRPDSGNLITERAGTNFLITSGP